MKKFSIFIVTLFLLVFPTVSFAGVTSFDTMAKDPSWKDWDCTPVMEFQKPGEISYPYFSVGICLYKGGESARWYLSNNCADTFYWTGIGDRLLNGKKPGTNCEADGSEISTSKSGFFQTGQSQGWYKIGPGEILITEPESVCKKAKPGKHPEMEKIKTYMLMPKYIAISATFSGDPVWFSEVFNQSLS
jgi:hypothetical protein